MPDGSYAGEAAGIIFDIEGVRIYHAGDTALTGEMKTTKNFTIRQSRFCRLAAHYTMDVVHASVAADWLGCKDCNS